MVHGKPVIGIAGGIGSGKSFVAQLFGELGCLVLCADEQVNEAYRRPDVRRTLRKWWGNDVFDRQGELNRPVVARRVFTDPVQRRRLEKLIHPIVQKLRDRAMAKSAKDAQVLAYVWDVPLLFEVGQDGFCDAVVFVQASRALRLKRVRARHGWGEAELKKREKSQMPLDKKRQMSDYVIRNTAGADQVRRQVREVLSRILAGMEDKARQVGRPVKRKHPRSFPRGH